MKTADLQPGDRIQCCVQGLPFEATVVRYDGESNRWLIKDTNPTVGRTSVTARQIVKKLDQPERLGEAA